HVEAIPSLGFLFDNWMGDLSGVVTSEELFMISDKSITANFSMDLSDNDSDGISAFDELVVYGINPESDDSDRDNLKDGDEIGTIFDPAIDDTPTLQLLAANPELYLDLVSNSEAVVPEIVITKSESGDFIIKVRIEATENLKDWESLDLSGAVIEGDTMTLIVPVSETATFLRTAEETAEGVKRRI
ncbi:MAG: hypothetical protein O7C75_10625, partial [Verrucomicrobia bacterium]|nr:hypothetical protein [Verrucomicrobiota bacterium]